MYFFFAYFCFVSAIPCFPSKATVNSTWLWTLFLRRSVLWLFRICYINQQVLSFMALVSAQYSLCSVPSSSCILWTPVVLLFYSPVSTQAGPVCTFVFSCWPCFHFYVRRQYHVSVLFWRPGSTSASLSMFLEFKLSGTLFHISPSVGPLISAASSCQLVTIIGTMTWRPSPLDSPASLA